MDLEEKMEGHRIIFRAIPLEADTVTGADLKEMVQVLEVEVDLTKVQM